MIQVSENQVASLMEKAAVGAGYDQGTGQWLAVVVTMALKAGRPGLSYARRALAAAPEPAQVQETAEGWRCSSKVSLVAGPILTDFIMASLPIAPPELDVPETWQTLMEGPQLNTQAPFHVEAEDWAFCEALAHKTYVPATDENRLSGAGAGVNDVCLLYTSDAADD